MTFHAPAAALTVGDPGDVASGPRRRWTVNGDFLTLAPTGVARYAREVTMALDGLVAEGHPLTRDLDLDIVAPREGDRPLRLDALRLRIVPEFSRPRLPQVWVQLQLPRHVQGGLVSLCNLAPVGVGRHIACIHDLHTRLMPDSYGRIFRLAHHIVLPMLGRRASAITTVSQHSREHLVRFGIAPADRIIVTYNGSDHVRRWDAAAPRLPAGSRPYVLCLGQAQAYKNIDLLARLAGPLDALGLDLWMAGGVDPAAVPQWSGGPPANVRLLGRISDDDLGSALAGALCFLFPSRIEGFGLPAVEAMALRCPVIASDAPCLPEVCGDAALYADPDDDRGWVAAIASLQSDPELRRRQVEAGVARARRYSWRRIAEQYLDLMARIDATAGAAAR